MRQVYATSELSETRHNQDELIGKRKVYKRAMKACAARGDLEGHGQNDAMQKSQKVTCNSEYGVTGETTKAKGVVSHLVLEGGKEFRLFSWPANSSRDVALKELQRTTYPGSRFVKGTDEPVEYDASCKYTAIAVTAWGRHCLNECIRVAEGDYGTLAKIRARVPSKLTPGDPDAPPCFPLVKVTKVVYGDTDSAFPDLPVEPEFANDPLTYMRRLAEIVIHYCARMNCELGRPGPDGVMAPHLQNLEFEKILMPGSVLIVCKMYSMLVLNDPGDLMQYDTYEALLKEVEHEDKGVVTARGDRAPVIMDMYTHLLDALHKIVPGEDHAARQVRVLAVFRQDLKDIMADRVPAEKYVMRMTLNKPGTSADKAADSLFRATQQRLKQGDSVPYVICRAVALPTARVSRGKGKAKSSVVKPVHPVAQSLDPTHNVIDRKYYVTNQGQGVITTLLQPVCSAQAINWVVNEVVFGHAPIALAFKLIRAKRPTPDTVTQSDGPPAKRARGLAALLRSAPPTAPPAPPPAPPAPPPTQVRAKRPLGPIAPTQQPAAKRARFGDAPLAMLVDDCSNMDSMDPLDPMDPATTGSPAADPPAHPLGMGGGSTRIPQRSPGPLATARTKVGKVKAKAAPAGCAFMRAFLKTHVVDGQ